MRRTVLCVSLLLLAGCASPLSELRERNPQSEDFTGSLASEYLAYAESESEQGRKFVAEHYAAKGLKVLKGETVEPEPVDTSLPPEYQQELLAARAQLMSLLLSGDLKREAPQELARAQLLFDCWQHELKRDINQDLAPCAEEFKATVAELDGLVYTEEDVHKLSFVKSSSRLSSKTHALIRKIAKEMASHSNYTIELSASETMGTREHKLVLARLSAVHKALEGAGVAEKHIEIKKEAENKKVYLSCDVPPVHPGTITLTVKTLE